MPHRNKTYAAPSEAELHAFVDGQLDQRRHMEVGAYLADHPDDMQRVAAYRAQNNELKAVLGDDSCRLLTGRLADLHEQMTRSLVRRRQVTRSAFAVVPAIAAVVIGIAVTWPVEQLDDQTVASSRGGGGIGMTEPRAHHLVSAEIETRDPSELSGWFAERIGGQTTNAPDYHDFGLSLVGGRVLTTTDGPAIQFLYQANTGDRVVLFIAMRDSEMHTALTSIRDGQASLYWRDGRYLYGLTGTMGRDELFTVAQATAEQVTAARGGDETTAVEFVRSERDPGSDVVLIESAQNKDTVEQSGIVEVPAAAIVSEPEHPEIVEPPETMDPAEGEEESPEPL